MVVFDGNFVLGCGPGTDYPYIYIYIHIFISMHARRNRSYNEWGSRTNYVRSSVPNCIALSLSVPSHLTAHVTDHQCLAVTPVRIPPITDRLCPAALNTTLPCNLATCFNPTGWEHTNETFSQPTICPNINPILGLYFFVFFSPQVWIEERTSPQQQVLVVDVKLLNL